MKSRRKFIKDGITISMALPLAGSQLLSCRQPQESTETVSHVPAPLRILILGGTSFLGPQQIAYAIARGHSITTFTRGRTDPKVHEDIFSQVEQLTGDRANDLSALENREWDVVIDNSGHVAEWTKRSAALLKDHAKQYIYTSSTGVYYPYLTGDLTEEINPVLSVPSGIESPEVQMEYDYGVMKANSEREAVQAFGEDRTLIIRPTYMIGPGDKSDRFIYWPVRLARGGEILVPGKAYDPVQYIDVRDVAEWMIRLAERKTAGTYNAVGPERSQGVADFVNTAMTAFDSPSTLVQVDDYDFLKANGIYDVIPWILPEENNYGSARIVNSKAIAAGLTFRDLKITTKETYDWWNSDSLTDERRMKFEQKPDSLSSREKSILEEWKKKNA